jgi:hypothetical protein
MGMRSQPRRNALRTRDGRVEKKNNWVDDRGDYFAWTQSEIRLDRKRPGAGYRHVVTLRQLRDFLTLLPDWDEVARGLDAIVLDEGRDDAMGWYNDSVVALCAWPAESGLWWEVDTSWLDDNAATLELLEVEVDEIDGRVGLLWTEAQARAFMLLDVLPHELGHHYDSLTTRSGRVGRGEPFATQYAQRTLETVWPAYCERFAIV